MFVTIKKLCLIGIGIITMQTFCFASIRAIIFDCDGVLVDTEFLKFEAWRSALSKYNITFTLDDYLPLVGHSSEKIAAEIKEQKKYILIKRN